MIAIFCKQATDNQIVYIYHTEKDAGRLNYAEIAKLEVKERGLEL
jgi:hypothetical protein